LAPRRSSPGNWEGRVLAQFSRVDDKLRRVLKQLDAVSRRRNPADDDGIRALAFANRELNKALDLFDRCRRETKRPLP
jgi:ABC-type transporter Mla subunit MlaD